MDDDVTQTPAQGQELDVLLKLYEDNRIYQRYHETQRLNFGNLSIIVCAAIFGVIGNLQFGKETFFLSVFVAALGIFGYIASEKLYDLTRLHRERTQHILEQISRLAPAAEIPKLYNSARQAYESRHKLITRFRLYEIWRSFFVLVFVIGIVLATASLWQWCSAPLRHLIFTSCA